LEKRIGAELIEGSPALFLDNLNNTEFESNLLASAITERPARVRLLSSHRLKLRKRRIRCARRICSSLLLAALMVACKLDWN
jgi:hypothetical protein